MTAQEATAEVFWTAFRALPKSEREAVIDRFFQNKEVLEDITDALLARQRLREKGRPLKDFEAELRRHGKL